MPRSSEDQAALADRLREHGIQPSAQRVAVAAFILHTDAHPSADEAWAKVRERFPLISRATVYNTLHLFARSGLLRELALAEGRVVYDPNTARHHHFIDEASGAIHDVPWEALKVQHVDALPGIEVRDYQVVMRGRRTRRSR
jgi:Fur family iron response transcriptional regulator